MKKNSFVLLLFVFIFTGCASKDNFKKTIVVTNFPTYDFVRAIVKDDSDINIKMLLKPGEEVHTYEPTPKDIKDIINSDIFIYVGGESDEWVDDILININPNKTKVIKLMDLVELKEEEIVEGMESEEEGEEEYDEHIWTSPINAITIIDSIKDDIILLDSNKKDYYLENANNYIAKLYEIDDEFKEIRANAKRNIIIFGDRFPLRYFVDQYNLDYYAAFPGCAAEVEASAKTISFLINKVKSLNIPVVFKIELSNSNIANTIAAETGAKVLEFKSAHNVSLDDFKNGVTYIDIMQHNISVLREALN